MISMKSTNPLKITVCCSLNQKDDIEYLVSKLHDINPNIIIYHPEMTEHKSLLIQEKKKELYSIY